MNRFSPETIENRFRDVRAWQRAAGADLKLKLTNTIRQSALIDRTIMGAVKERLDVGDYAVIVPVPGGATILAGWSINTLPAANVTRMPSQNYEINRGGERVFQAGRIAVFETVIVTGKSAAKTAQAIREINPSAQIDLVAIWREGSVLPKYDGYFNDQLYVVEDSLYDYETLNEAQA